MKTHITHFTPVRSTGQPLVRGQVPGRFYRGWLFIALLVLSASTLTVAQSPSANLTFPQFNSSYLSGTPINLQATATTPAGTTITKVEFYFATDFFSSGLTNPTNGTKIGESLTAPYSIVWTPPAVPATGRSYQVRAVVTNSAGNTAIQSGTGYASFTVYPTNYVSTRNWYVSATASATNTAGTEALPFNTIQKAADRVAPGDTVFVMAGRYTATSINVVSIQRTGIPSRSIVFMPYRADKPIIALGNNNFNGINVLPAAAYIRIQGLEVIGNNANITLEQARLQPGACEGPNPTATPTARFNGNGISITGSRGGNVRPHHVVIAGNSVHDCAGGGIGGGECDYVTFENNVIYNTSWYTVYGTSGLNIINAWNYDNNTTTPRIIIRNNRSFGNILKVAWNIGGTGTNCKFFDGNGIILDNNKAVDPSRPTVIKNALGDYTGKFLVENNLCYQNGGRGINVNYSDNATIINNTTYQNGASDGGPGIGIESEFIAQGANAIRVYNNIFYGRPGERVTEVNSSTIVHNNNLTFEGTGTPFFRGNQNIVGQNPQFVDAANGDFRLMPTSPALNAGSSAPDQYTAKDFVGVDRPQGAGVDIGAYELQGTSLSVTQQPASGSVVCAGAPVSVSVAVDGPVQRYQWYKDGILLTGVASATTATLSFSAVNTTDQGSYVAVVSGFTNVTTTAFNLTVNALPQAPTLLTQVGQPYPGGQTSLTISQNTGPVVLAADGCTGGTVNWAGGAATTLAVATSTTGVFTYTATCQRGDCISPVATATVTVVPTTLRVLHRDASNGQFNTNAITPYLLLTNAGNTAIPYGEISVRYWLTAENAVSVSNLAVFYAQLGTDKVRMTYVPLAQPRQGAYGYVEYRFDASAGSLAAGGDSGPIDNRIAKSDYSNFNQSDDYSYMLNRDFTPNVRITAYRTGSNGVPTLFWGQEPAPVTPTTSLVAYTQNNNGPASNAISTHLEVRNTGNLPVAYGDITVRYYFTADGPQALNLSTGYIQLGSANVTGQLVRLPSPLVNADTYLEWRFSAGLGSLSPGSNTGIIPYQITKSDYSYFDMSNDHAFRGTSPLVENDRVVVYVAGQRVYGQEPASTTNGTLNTRLSAEPAGLQLTVLGNPTAGDVVGLEVRGAEGQALNVDLIDGQGKRISGQRIERAGAAERLRLSTGRSAGVLLLRVTTASESRTVKLVNP